MTIQFVVVDKELKKQDSQYTTNCSLPYSFTEKNHTKHYQLIGAETTQTNKPKYIN